MNKILSLQIKARAVESMAGLHSLTLHGNPWGCDCGLRPLLDWLVIIIIVIIIIITITSPDIRSAPICLWWTPPGASPRPDWRVRGLLTSL